MSERFHFGKNWQRFVDKGFSEDKVTRSKSALSTMLGISSLEGMSFLDIGCGSGLSSLAALRLGATTVVSLDYDEQSVIAAQKLHAYEGNPSNWNIFKGDVLDTQSLKNFSKFDIVYSWGVLHHTGDMARAIANSTIPLHQNGLLLLALYSHTAYQNGEVFGQPSPKEWLGIKHRYLKASDPIRRWMMIEYLWRRYFSTAHWDLRKLTHGAKELHARWKSYQESQRGMDFITDIHDWLGGWPMEFINEWDLQQQMYAEFNIELLRMETGRGNTQFLFRRIGASNAWDRILQQRTIHPLPGPYRQVAPLVWRAEVCSEVANDEGCWLSSPLRIRENQFQLPYAHTPYQALSRFGFGRYLHKADGVYFSTSDNTNPNENGRAYTYYVDIQQD